MKKRIKQKIKSKKGLTLVEILVGVALVVIVFASTLGAMVGGFTTTVYNSDENRASVLNASVNEIIFNTVRKMRISDYDEAADFLEEVEAAATSSGSVADDTYAYALVASVAAQVPDAKYVVPEYEGGAYSVSFPSGESYQYSLIPEQKKPLGMLTASGTDYEIDGITIKTCFESAGGPIIYESFVAFSK